MSEEIAFLSASELTRHFADGSLSPVEVSEAMLSRIEALDGRLNAFVLVDPGSALAAARESQERWRLGAARGPIDGVPVAVKDVLRTAGWPTLYGSHSVDPAGEWTEDAPSVARLREHGAVLIGKTTTPEYGWKGVTDSPRHGITRNPWNPARTPGGSSGGSAAAVAAGMATMALGTDGGGSIRIPAAFTGVVGLKPTFGRVPLYPPSVFGTLSHVGPLTRSIEDAALLLGVISAPDPRDWRALPPEGGGGGTIYLRGLEGGVEGMKIAFSPTLGGHQVDPEIARLVAAAAERFSELGAEVVEDDPQLPDCDEPFRVLWFSAAARLLKQLSAERLERLDPGLREIGAEGSRYDLDDYLAAREAREIIGRKLSLFFRGYDLLLTPSLPIEAFEAGLERPAGLAGDRWVSWTPFSYPFNLTKNPALSVPCGFTAAALPAGLQIVGPLYGDATVLRAGFAFEAGRPPARPQLASVGRSSDPSA